MGCGKTSVGKEVARMLGFDFVDTDEEIVVEAGGRPITEIFDTEGEDGFRDRESAILQRVSESSQQVVSTGGGLPLRPENRILLNSMGYVVWLDAELESILHRVAGNHDRPLLEVTDRDEKVRELFAERRPIYKGGCDLRVETDGLQIGDVAYGVSESARVYLSEES